jgi:hypothetical protein
VTSQDIVHENPEQNIQKIPIKSSRFKKPIYYGVPQGGTLLPLLFVVLTADMPEAVKGAELVLYADDTTGTVWSDTREEVYWKMEYTTKETLDHIHCNKLAPNAGKTQFMVLGKGELKQIIDRGAPVQESRQVTFLGLELTGVATGVTMWGKWRRRWLLGQEFCTGCGISCQKGPWCK